MCRAGLVIIARRASLGEHDGAPYMRSSMLSRSRMESEVLRLLIQSAERSGQFPHQAPPSQGPLFAFRACRERREKTSPR